ncbi:RNA pol II accessory factor, Cdc73 family-domain-containing protein [Leucosporidium creatinivorum]|uniref:RNA pol II accessory factor, Cdc73 family-domain-containing protein n=1 Tax=Leucosporidium creatinivorum TaxID=106004 RepID=A0A1Y2CC82_9BASI|nr:RNA pol II accessory factor, Cdc73 family-domain-containing protein [Leucosporidium creatinivorum]
MTTDPLLLLRSALSTGNKINLLDASGTEVFSLTSASTIAFPPYSPSTTFPKSTPTRYLTGAVAHSSSGARPTYDLQTLLHAYLLRDSPVPEYMKQSREGGVPFVSVTDRRFVVEYLGGKGSEEGEEGRVLPLGGAGVAGEGAAATGPTPAKREGGDLDSTTAPTATDSRPSSTRPSDGAAPSSAKKARFVPNKEDQEKVKRMMETIQGPVWGVEVASSEQQQGGVSKAAALDKVGGVTQNRVTVLAGQRVNNFESVRALVAPRIKLSRDEENERGAAASAAAKESAASGAPTTTAGGQPLKPRKKALNPIIIISPSSTALISMHNVRKLLEESIFVHPEEARIQAGTAAEDMVQVSHARTTSSISSSLNGQQEARKARYFVVDGVEALAKFGPDAWDRVVCVMTTGQEWQFRPYKWTEPKELFHHVKGVFVQWTTDAPNEKVRKWNVNELRIDPSKRHIDKSTVAGFWRELEAWIALHKPGLTY